MFRFLIIPAIAALVIGGWHGSEHRHVSAEQPLLTLASNAVLLDLDFAPGRAGFAYVTATFTTADTEPARRILLQMRDGEAVSLALPGRPGTRYHFAREGDRVTARIES